MSTRTILAFDASTPRTAIALGVLDLERGEATQLAGVDVLDDASQASTWLVDQIMATLASAKIQGRALDLIACGVGPGTFTGARVAVATAKGLALGLDRPVLPLSTLAAVAASQPRRGAIVATLDARRGELYAARFDVEPEPAAMSGLHVRRRSQDTFVAAADLLAEIAQLAAAPTIVGTGVHVIAAALAGSQSPTPALLPLDGVHAAGLWQATCDAFAAGVSLHPRELDAVYLRGSYAELGVNRPKRPFVPSPFA